jgi:spermidine/putrescine transport system ATP-binding protein
LTVVSTIATGQPASASLRNVTKRFGDSVAVDDVSLEIAAGEFFSILGPSGCGKTTTLRMLAGLAIPEEGEIFLGDNEVTQVPPYRRDVNTVFQSYALFEHLDVSENVAFGLKRRRVPRTEISRRVGEALELVGLRDRAHARPIELSGGQQQRVALARALVNVPGVLLLDEPLGALDLQLRRQMQVELKTIHREVGTTFVYVTHDQEEALAMSDRIAIMNSGQLQQVGRPADIYERPASAFVASFIGTSNLLSGTVQHDGVVVLGGLVMPLDQRTRDGFVPGEAITVSIRPEKILLGDDVEGSCSRVRARVADVIYLGSTTHIALEASNQERIVAILSQTGRGDRRPAPQRGDDIQIGWHPADALLLSEDRAKGNR